MFSEAITILILFYLHGVDLKEEGICGSSIEMRKVALNKQLTAVGCEDYHCGKLINYNYYYYHREVGWNNTPPSLKIYFRSS